MPVADWLDGIKPTAAEDHIACHSCQIRKGNWGYSLHGVTNLKSGKKQFHSDGRARMRWKLHESIALFCLVSTFQATGCGVTVIFFANFGPIGTDWALFKCYSLAYCYWSYLSPLTTIYPRSLSSLTYLIKWQVWYIVLWTLVISLKTYTKIHFMHIKHLQVSVGQTRFYIWHCGCT